MSRDAHVVGHVLDVLCPVLVPVTVVAVLAVSDALVVITAEFVLVATDAAPAVDVEDAEAAEPVVHPTVLAAVKEIAMVNVLPATDVAPVVVAMVHVRLDVTAVATRAHTQIYSVASNIVLC